MSSVSSKKQGHIPNLDHSSHTDLFTSSASTSQPLHDRSRDTAFDGPFTDTIGLMPDGISYSDDLSFTDPLSNGISHQSLTNGHGVDLGVPQLNPNSLSPSPPSVFNHLSPSVVAGYTSDNGPSEISDYTTPGFDDDLINVDFTFPNLEEAQDPATTPAAHIFTTSESQQPSQVATDRLHSQPSNSSSYLISPVHTNTSSPSNRAEYQPSGLPNTQTISPVPSYVHVNTMQQTPALTGSSKSSSQDGRGTHLTSPIVTVENYSRDDSPSREPLHRNFSRRSRASQRSATHLSARHFEDDPSSSEDEAEEQRARDRSGYNPSARDNTEIPSLNEEAEGRLVAEKNAEVAHWLATSEAGSEAGDPPSPRSRLPRRKSKPRRRAVSVGAPGQFNERVSQPDDTLIPGPGALLDEESGEDYSDDGISTQPSEASDDAEPPADVTKDEILDENLDYFPTVQEEPSPSQFASFRVRPWGDPPFDNDRPTEEQIQPLTSNQAAVLWKRRAAAIDTSSRVATWGTRRLSDTDIERFVKDGGIFKRLSFSKEKQRPKNEKRPSGILNTLLTRVPSKNRRGSEKGPHPPKPSSGQQDRKDSDSSLMSPSRTTSFPQTSRRNTRLTTMEAFAGMSGQLGVVASSSSTIGTPVPPSQPPTMLERGKQVLKRARSKSDLTKKQPPPSEGLSTLWTKAGGPPVATLATPSIDEGQSGPSQQQQPQPPRQAPRSRPADEMEEDDDDDDENPEVGIKMDLSISLEPIIPTAQGFLNNVRQLNPRLAPFLADRISHEQLTRYKRLVKAKIGHLNAVANGTCPSGPTFCPDSGGEAKPLQPKVSQREPDTQFAGFQVYTTTVSDDEEQSNFSEGVVAPAQFPPGVPLPPTKRLPAEFECPLCFKVKRFHKPSDWTKHVHEDVQPFTCTWPNCTEPKSFKRKADWVRHENERHRKLEWWECNVQECAHICYRRDNFVQHLVREHKMKDPKSQPSKGKSSGTGKGKMRRSPMDDTWMAEEEQLQADIERLWSCVDTCHHETSKKPQEEACKFCGNICSSWKKLTVHLARHMEQISLPVLTLVEQRQVAPDTLISPVGKPLPSSASPISPEVHMRNEPFHSPYGSSSGLSISQNRFASAHSLSPATPHHPEPYGTYVEPTGYPNISHVQNLPAGFQIPSGQQQQRPQHPPSQDTFDATYPLGFAHPVYGQYEGRIPAEEYASLQSRQQQYHGQQGGGQMVNPQPAVTNYPATTGVTSQYQPHEIYHGASAGQVFGGSANQTAIPEQSFDFGFDTGQQVPLSQAPGEQSHAFHHPQQQHQHQQHPF